MDSRTANNDCLDFKKVTNLFILLQHCSVPTDFYYTAYNCPLIGRKHSEQMQFKDSRRILHEGIRKTSYGYELVATVGEGCFKTDITIFRLEKKCCISFQN